MSEPRFATIIEPFRVKMVEPLRLTTVAEREQVLTAAGYNLFLVRAEDVLIDLLTDSGTGAMSDGQWAALMRGDESYAGSRSYLRFAETVRRITGLPEVIPTHQGRAAEALLFALVCKSGDVVPNNTHFDTTRANLEALGVTALDLPCAEVASLGSRHPFKGNMDVAALRQAFARHGRERIPFVMMTVTNNAGGGQPASLDNLRAVAAACREHDRPLYIDACRFAENAYLIQRSEPGQSGRSVAAIASSMFELAEGCTMSAKKDGMANIGGFLALRSAALARAARERMVLAEGFPTYGGLAGRDLEAVAQGLEEVLSEDYLAYRIASTSYLGEHLAREGVPVMLPPGGHAIYLDARAFAPHLSPLELPGIALAAELYRLAGVRSVEIGTAMFGKRDPATGTELPGPRELVRLAIPRRVYTQSHIDYVVEAVCAVHARRTELRPYRIVEQPERLRHFSARYAPLP